MHLEKVSISNSFCIATGANSSSAVDLIKAALPLPQLKFADDYSSAEAVSSYGVVTARTYSLPSAAADLTIKQGDTGFIANFSYYLSKHRCWERETDGLCARVAF